MFAANFQQQLNQVNQQQNQIAQNHANLQANINNLAFQAQRGQRQKDALYDAFKSFFGNCTLNEATVNNQNKLETLYTSIMFALACQVDGHNAGTILATHCKNYQCVLLPGKPAINTVLNVGYYLYQTQQVAQTYVIIIHPNPIPQESFNLSVLAPPTDIAQLLNNLVFPAPNAAAINVNLPASLLYWIGSQSQQNKTNLLSNDIFLTDETTVEFKNYLSKESRKPQIVPGIQRPLVKENGWWASIGAFFGNTAGTIWYWGNKPQTYGYDTVVIQTDQERANGGRNPEIISIFTTIANRYIQNNLEKIDPAVRTCCQNGMRDI